MQDNVAPPPPPPPLPEIISYHVKSSVKRQGKGHREEIFCCTFLVSRFLLHNVCNINYKSTNSNK